MGRKGTQVYKVIQVAQLVEHQVLRFSFPGKKILGLVYKCYRNAFSAAASYNVIFLCSARY